MGASFISSKTPNLRVITKTNHVAKFRAGRFETDNPALVAEVIEFARDHPNYGIEQVGGAHLPEPEPIPDDDQVVEDEFDSMSVEELKDELREQGLKVTGNRAQLLARLRGEEGEE